MKSKRAYTDDELKFFEKLTDDLIIWLFNTKDKRYAINETIKKAYIEGVENAI